MSNRHLLMLVPSLAAIAWGQAAETGPASADGTHTVTVTATRLEQSPFDQPYAITRTDRTALDETSARTLIDAVDATPGVHIQHTAPNQASPYIRGLTGEQTLLLFDGVRLNHAMMRSGPNQYAALIPDQQVSAIDTILGSSSTVTGSDGLTGALDFRLATPGRGIDRAFSPWAKTRLSSAEGGGIAGGFDGAAGSWRWSVDGSYDSYGTLRGGKDAGDHLYGNASGDRDIPHTAYNQDTIGARVAFDGWKGQTWELAGGRTAQHDSPRPDGYVENSNVASRISRYFDPQVFSYLHARHRTENCGPFSSTQTTIWMHQQDETQFREDVDGTGATARYRLRENDDCVTTLGGDLQLTNRIAKAHALTWGGTAYRDSIDSTYARLRSPVGNMDPAAAVLDQTDATVPGATSIPDGAHYTGVGIFAQDLWTIADQWDVLGGLRWSRYDWAGDVTPDRAGYAAFGNATLKDHDQAFTGNLRLGWHPVPVAMAFAGISQGFRAPNLTNLMGARDRASSSSGGQGPQTQGNPDLDSERSLTWEVGAKYADGRDTASLTLFRTELKDLIETVYADLNGDGQITNVDTARSVNAEGGLLYGLEVANDCALPLPLPKGWRLAIIQATSVVHGTVDVPQANLTTKEEYISRANRFFGKAGLRLDVASAWYVIGQTRWSAAYDQVSPGDATDTRQTTFGSADGSMPGYAVLDLLGGWYSPEKAFAINGGLQNLGDVSYRNVGSGTDGCGLSAVLGASARF